MPPKPMTRSPSSSGMTAVMLLIRCGSGSCVISFRSAATVGRKVTRKLFLVCRDGDRDGRDLRRERRLAEQAEPRIGIPLARDLEHRLVVLAPHRAVRHQRAFL